MNILVIIIAALFLIGITLFFVFKNKTNQKSQPTLNPKLEEIDDEMLDQVTGGIHGYSVGKRGKNAN
ncbi:MAG: hypothetical protein J6W43_05900 [Prevotella sp.]|nr:hypothetical protein [Prevotella sp.]